jgi:hypothetical protein
MTTAVRPLREKRSREDIEREDRRARGLEGRGKEEEA